MADTQGQTENPPSSRTGDSSTESTDVGRASFPLDTKEKPANELLPPFFPLDEKRPIPPETENAVAAGKSNASPQNNNEVTKVRSHGAQSESGEVPTRTKVIIVAALCINLFLAALDQTIVTTALPRIIEDLGDARGYSWCGSSFLVAAAAFITSWGKLSDIWGRKPIIMTASVIFMIGSVISGAATKMAMLLAGRTIQGFGAGGIIALVNITVSDIVSLRERGKYLSMVGFTWAIASSAGPILGGAFADHASWRWCFYVNLPVGGVAMLAIFFYLHLDSPKISAREGLSKVDWAGSLTGILAVTLFLVGLEMGGVQYSWKSAIVLVLVILGVAFWLVFLWVELKFAKFPIMPLRLFHHKTNIAGYIVTFMHGQVFMGIAFYMPLYFQAVKGASPLKSGVLTMPLVLVLSLFSVVNGVVIAKTGRYQEMIWAGCVFMAAGSAALSNLDRTSPWPKWFFYQFITGVGIGPLFQGPLIAIHSTINPKDIGTATAAFSFIRNVSAAIGITVGGVIFQNAIQKHQSALIKSVGPKAAEAASGRQAAASVQFVQQLPEGPRHTIQDAYADALSEMWWYYFATSVAAIAASLFIGRHKLSKNSTAQQGVKKRVSKKKKDGEKEKEVGKDVA